MTSPFSYNTVPLNTLSGKIVKGEIGQNSFRNEDSSLLNVEIGIRFGIEERVHICRRPANTRHSINSYEQYDEKTDSYCSPSSSRISSPGT